MKKNFIIGLCAIAAVAVLFFGIDFLKGINIFKPSNYYQASCNVGVGCLIVVGGLEDVYSFEKIYSEKQYCNGSDGTEAYYKVLFHEKRHVSFVGKCVEGLVEGELGEKL